MTTDQPDALERALEFGAQFDMISPLCTIVRDLLHGPVEWFVFHRGEWLAAEDALKRRRIFTWGWYLLEKPWMVLHCKRSAAGLVALTLRQAGIVHTTTWDARRQPRRKRGRRR